MYISKGLVFETKKYQSLSLLEFTLSI